MKWYELLMIAVLGVFLNTNGYAFETEAVQEVEISTVVQPPHLERITVETQVVPFKINAKYALVIDQTTGEILYAKGADTIVPIASITKLMTAVVTLDASLDLEETIQISQEEVNATMLRGRVTSKSLPMGATLSRAELLHVTLMNSQNRAAVALARTYPGGTEAFVAAMNRKAEMLGMKDTNFTDPAGLYNTNVSSAIDLVILLRHAEDYVLIRDFSTSESFALSMYSKKKRRPHLVKFGTTNRLVRNDSWDIVVQKTGYIRDAGHCVAMTARTVTNTISIILLNTTNNTARANDAIRIKHYIETGEILQPMKAKRKKRRA